MLEVTREDLIESEAALSVIGRTIMPVAKDRYWFAKSINKIAKALKQAKRGSQDENNRLIGELGYDNKSAQSGKTVKGIDKADLETMQKYEDAMRKWHDVEVEIDAQPVKLSVLEELKVSLSIGDQAALGWFIQED